MREKSPGFLFLVRVSCFLFLVSCFGIPQGASAGLKVIGQGPEAEGDFCRSAVEAAHGLAVLVHDTQRGLLLREPAQHRHTSGEAPPLRFAPTVVEERSERGAAAAAIAEDVGSVILDRGRGVDSRASSPAAKGTRTTHDAFGVRRRDASQKSVEFDVHESDQL